MKRAYAFILVLFLAVLLTGCGGSNSEKSGSKVICVMEQKRDEVTMVGTFVGNVDENDRITTLKFDLEGTISEDYYAQLNKINIG